MVDVDVCISSHLKEELTWAIDKWLRVISTIIIYSTLRRRIKGTKCASFSIKHKGAVWKKAQL